MRRENGLIVFGDQNDIDNIYWGFEGIAVRLVWPDDEYDVKSIFIEEIRYDPNEGVYVSNDFMYVQFSVNVTINSSESILKFVKDILEEHYPNMLEFGFPEIAITEPDLEYLYAW